MSNYLDNFLAAYSEGFGYAFDNNIISSWYPERIIELSAHRNGKLLELGIGRGVTTNRFSRSFRHHVVVDGAASVIEQFRNQFPDCTATVVQSLFEDFASEDKFDAIVMGFVLEHVTDPQMILKKCQSLLLPHGQLFVAVPNGESLHRRFGQAAGVLSDLMTLGQADLELGHQRVYSVETLSHELETAGYHVLRKEGIFLKPLTTAQLLSLKLDARIIQAMCQVGVEYPELSCALLFEATVGNEGSF